MPARTTFRNEIYDKYKANRPEPPEDLIPQFPLIREAAKAFNVTVLRARGLRGRRPDRDLRPPGGRGRRHLHHRVVRQGPDAAHPAGRRDDGPDQEDQARARGGDGEVRRHAGQGRRRAGAGRRFDRQRAGRAGHRRQDRGPAASTSTATSRRCWRAPARSSSPSGARRCSSNAELARISRKLVHAQGRRADAGRARRLRQAKPDPNVLLPWLEQQGFKSLLARYTKRAGRGDQPRRAGSAAGRQRRACPRRRPSPRRRRAPSPTSPSPPPTTRLIRTRRRSTNGSPRRPSAGVVAFDCETDALDANNAGLVGVSLALLEGPWGNVNSSRAARGLPADRPSRAGRRGAGRARSRRRRRQGQRCRQAAARPAAAQDGDRQAEAAARGPGRAEGRPEHQVRHVRVRAGTASRSAPVDDTMLLSFVLDAGKHSHGMDDLAERYLGQETIKFSDVAGSGAKQVSFDKVPIDKARDYAAEDADVTLQLWAQFKPRLAARAHGGRVRDDRAAADPRAARHGAGRHQGRRAAAARRCRPSSRSGMARARAARSTRSPAARSMSARPSSWARSCSTSRSCRAASATRTARGRPTSASSRTSPPRAMRCRSRSWSTARSPSSRAPTPTRWCASSTPRPAASTPPIR